jgi:pimeloyl-ACP methyl ester carboxylesterase
MMNGMYQVLKNSASQFVPIRNLQYHVRTWGTRKAEQLPLVMVHGWMDVSASFQFVVDALKQDRYIVAPDWRGYGKTVVPSTDNYWIPDYLADLDFLLDWIELENNPDGCKQVDLLGHSLGGNVVMLYSGIKPERIHRLINLEGFGMPRTKPENAAKRYVQWMNELKKMNKGELNLTAYESADGVARRLMKTNKRISEDKAQWLARQWASENINGKWDILGDAAHKVVNANLYQVDEAISLYQQITAPTLAVEAADNEMNKWWAGKFTLAEYHERLKSVPNCRIEAVANAGHMMHHDQPEVLARMIEEFLD